eukprot:29227-Eustigmatos_ZCMA.PRE.1
MYLALGHLLELLGEVELVLLDQGATDRQAAGFEEREDHATADHQAVDLVNQRLHHRDLGRHLGPAHNGHERALGLGHGT